MRVRRIPGSCRWSRCIDSIAARVLTRSWAEAGTGTSPDLRPAATEPNTSCAKVWRMMTPQSSTAGNGRGGAPALRRTHSTTKRSSSDSDAVAAGEPIDLVLVRRACI